MLNRVRYLAETSLGVASFEDMDLGEGHAESPLLIVTLNRSTCAISGFSCLLGRPSKSVGFTRRTNSGLGHCARARRAPRRHRLLLAGALGAMGQLHRQRHLWGGSPARGAILPCRRHGQSRRPADRRPHARSIAALPRGAERCTPAPHAHAVGSRPRSIRPAWEGAYCLAVFPTLPLVATGGHRIAAIGDARARSCSMVAGTCR